MENIPKVITSIEDISIEYSFKDYNIQGLSVINNEQTEHFLIYEIFNLKDNRYYIG